MSLSLCLGPPQLWAGGPAPYLAVQLCFCCGCFHVSWPAPLQPYSSQDHSWHGLALLAQDWRPFTRAADRSASPGTALPLSTPILLHLTTHQSKPWGPSTTGGAPEELERGERRGANALDPPAPLADCAPPRRRRERRGYRRQPVPPFPARGKKSVTFFRILYIRNKNAVKTYEQNRKHT